MVVIVLRMKRQWSYKTSLWVQEVLEKVVGLEERLVQAWAVQEEKEGIEAWVDHGRHLWNHLVRTNKALVIIIISFIFSRSRVDLVGVLIVMQICEMEGERGVVMVHRHPVLDEAGITHQRSGEDDHLALMCVVVVHPLATVTIHTTHHITWATINIITWAT